MVLLGRHRLDYSKIRVEDVPKLSPHHQHQYNVWLESNKKRKQASNDFLRDDFLRCFEESCDVYKKNEKHK